MLRQFLNAITKIFDLPTWFQTIPLTGADTGHSLRGVAALVLVGALLKMRSLEWSNSSDGVGGGVSSALSNSLCNIP